MCWGLSPAVALSCYVLVWQSGSSDVRSSGQSTPRCVSCGTGTQPPVPSASPSVVLCASPLPLTGALSLHLPVGEEPAFLPCCCRGCRCPRSTALRSKALPAAPVGPGLLLALLAAYQHSPPLIWPVPGRKLHFHIPPFGAVESRTLSVFFNESERKFRSHALRGRAELALGQVCDLCSLLSVAQDLTGLCPCSLALGAARRYPKHWQTALGSHCGSALATVELFLLGTHLSLDGQMIKPFFSRCCCCELLRSSVLWSGRCSHCRSVFMLYWGNWFIWETLQALSKQLQVSLTFIFPGLFQLLPAPCVELLPSPKGPVATS